MNSSLSNTHPQPSQMNQPRPIPPPPRPVNGSQPNGLHAVPGNPHTIPHAPMQSHPMQQRMQPQMSSDNIRIYHEATRVQAEQQRFLLHQRQQQLPHINGQATNSASPNMGSLKPMTQTNPAMLPSLHGRSSSPSATAGGLAPTGSSSSPRMTTAGQAQSLSSGLVPAVNEISNQIKNLHPNASPEQLKRMTTDALMKFRNNHAAQAAMHAAAGTNASLIGNMNMPNLSTPPPPSQPAMMNGVNRSPPLYNPQQQYSQILRNQQSSQQSRNTAPGMGGTRPASRCGTPQMHRSGSMQGVTVPGQSPRPGPAQIAGPQ
jgi:chromatin modification-related protein VID21